MYTVINSNRNTFSLIFWHRKPVFLFVTVWFVWHRKQMFKVPKTNGIEHVKIKTQFSINSLNILLQCNPLLS